jgi:glycine C-acetyltransferase/8-amino-7-oxononanoate synthase
MSDIAERLAELADAGLRRELRTVEGPQGPRVLLDGREVLLLCSNNYLGLATHPAVTGAASSAATRWGAGAGASRLVSGTMVLHEQLEQGLARFHDHEAALLFGSGYLANLGTIGALTREGNCVFSDELNHASIVDGCRLARAETVVYRHCDTEHLDWAMRRRRGRASLIVTDGVFSMDGDIAPLEQLVELARDHGARLLVDEAHATGAIGPGGRGTVAAAGVEAEVDVIVGTLGKSLGSYGAYVCARAEVIELLVNVARPFIYSTALPPPTLAAASAALEILTSHTDRVERLRRNARELRSALDSHGLDVGTGRTHIVPLITGSADSALAMCDRALDGGVFAQAIRPPTVPAGSSRLRLSVMATHSRRELTDAAQVLADAANELRFTGAGGRAVDPARKSIARADLERVA